MNRAAIEKAFEAFLRKRSLKLTSQRRSILARAFATHEHFSAETLYGWLKAESAGRVSRATVYRTLTLLVDGGFLESLDPGTGELVYEHVLGHRHHDHMLCLSCGRIDEFFDPRIEELQVENCRRKGFDLVHHSLRLRGYCRACSRKRARGDGGAQTRVRAQDDPQRARGPSDPPRERGGRRAGAGLSAAPAAR